MSRPSGQSHSPRRTIPTGTKERRSKGASRLTHLSRFEPIHAFFIAGVLVIILVPLFASWARPAATVSFKTEGDPLMQVEEENALGRWRLNATANELEIPGVEGFTSGDVDVGLAGTAGVCASLARALEANCVADRIELDPLVYIAVSGLGHFRAQTTIQDLRSARWDAGGGGVRQALLIAEIRTERAPYLCITDVADALRLHVQTSTATVEVSLRGATCSDATTLAVDGPPSQPVQLQLFSASSWVAAEASHAEFSGAAGSFSINAREESVETSGRISVETGVPCLRLGASGVGCPLYVVTRQGSAKGTDLPNLDVGATLEATVVESLLVDGRTQLLPSYWTLYSGEILGLFGIAVGVLGIGFGFSQRRRAEVEAIDGDAHGGKNRARG